MTTHEHHEHHDAGHHEGRDHHQPLVEPVEPVHELSTDRTALAELKQEIINSLSRQRRAPLSWGSMTVSVVLGLLALVAVVQVVQSASLYQKLNSDDFQATAAAPAATNGSTTSLPNQVGGC